MRWWGADRRPGAAARKVPASNVDPVAQRGLAENDAQREHAHDRMLQQHASGASQVESVMIRIMIRPPGMNWGVPAPWVGWRKRWALGQRAAAPKKRYIHRRRTDNRWQQRHCSRRGEGCQLYRGTASQILALLAYTPIL